MNSAEIASDGIISALFTISDPRGLPLDREGITTPGSVALSFIAAHIPQGQQQYVAYTTRRVTGAVSGTVTQAGPIRAVLTQKSPMANIDINGVWYARGVRL